MGQWPLRRPASQAAASVWQSLAGPEVAVLAGRPAAVHGLAPHECCVGDRSCTSGCHDAGNVTRGAAARGALELYDSGHTACRHDGLQAQQACSNPAWQRPGLLHHGERRSTPGRQTGTWLAAELTSLATFGAAKVTGSSCWQPAQETRCSEQGRLQPKVVACKYGTAACTLACAGLVAS
jgi:hypothetical protein